MGILDRFLNGKETEAAESAVSESAVAPSAPLALTEQHFDALAERVRELPPEAQNIVKSILDVSAELVEENAALRKSLAETAPDPDAALDEDALPEDALSGDELEDDDEAAALAGDGDNGAVSPNEAEAIGTPDADADSEEDAPLQKGAVASTQGNGDADEFFDASGILTEIAKSLADIQSQVGTLAQRTDALEKQTGDGLEALSKGLSELSDAQTQNTIQQEQLIAKGLETLAESAARLPATVHNTAATSEAFAKSMGVRPKPKAVSTPGASTASAATGDGVREAYGETVAPVAAEPMRYGLTDKQLKDGIFQSLSDDTISKSLAGSNISTQTLMDIATTAAADRPVEWYRVAGQALGITIDEAQP